MAPGIYFNVVPTRCPPSSLCICAALASVIEATCGSFEKVKEGTDWRKITGWEQWLKRRAADKEIGADWFFRDKCMSLSGWGCRRSVCVCVCVRVVVGNGGAGVEEWARESRGLRGARERKCVTGERGSWRTTAQAAQRADISSSAPTKRNHRDINPRLRM